MEMTNVGKYKAPFRRRVPVIYIDSDMFPYVEMDYRLPSADYGYNISARCIRVTIYFPNGISNISFSLYIGKKYSTSELAHVFPNYEFLFSHLRKIGFSYFLSNNEFHLKDIVELLSQSETDTINIPYILGSCLGENDLVFSKSETRGLFLAELCELVNGWQNSLMGIDKDSPEYMQLVKEAWNQIRQKIKKAESLSMPEVITPSDLTYQEPHPNTPTAATASTHIHKIRYPRLRTFPNIVCSQPIASNSTRILVSISFSKEQEPYVFNLFSEDAGIIYSIQDLVEKGVLHIGDSDIDNFYYNCAKGPQSSSEMNKSITHIISSPESLWDDPNTTFYDRNGAEAHTKFSMVNSFPIKHNDIVFPNSESRIGFIQELTALIDKFADLFEDYDIDENNIDNCIDEIEELIKRIQAQQSGPYQPQILTGQIRIRKYQYK